jgi:hypothetical protein
MDLDAATEYEASASAMQAALYATIIPTVEDFLTRFYPNLTPLMNAVESWLLNTIQNGGSGLPVAIEEAIWARTRDRAVREGQRQKAEAVAEFASRGFSLPPGALLSRTDSIDQDTQNKVAEAARDIAIDQAKQEIENIRFAISTAAGYRQNAIQSALTYLREWMQIPETAAKRAAMLAELRMKLWETTAMYYRAVNEAHEIGFKYDSANQISQLRQFEFVKDFSVQGYEAKVRGAAAAADAIAKVAQAAISSQTAIAHLADTTQRRA